MGTALQTQNPRVSDVLASILHEAPVGLWSCQKSAMDERNEREREIHIGSKDTRDEGKTDRDRNIYTWNVSGYGAVCKCYDPLLCSSSLFVAVLPPRLTRSTMAPMGPREFCLLAFSR